MRNPTPEKLRQMVARARTREEWEAAREAIRRALTPARAQAADLDAACDRKARELGLEFPRWW